ncbi:uncharacterized protein TNCV_4045991 [Trichonephila clavipes]|nr:uncharacterized protein TNCV_4045991 [Trichonephila clavipes]
MVFSKEYRFNLCCDDSRFRVLIPRGEGLNPAFALQRHTTPTAGESEEKLEEGSPYASKESVTPTSKEATLSASKEESPSTSKETSPSASKEAGPSTSKEASPTASKEESPSASKEASPSPSKETSPSSSKEASPSPSKEASPSVSKEASLSASKETGTSPSEEKEAEDLTISIPEMTKDKSLDEVTEEEIAAEVRAVAAEILEKTSDQKEAAKELLEGSPEKETEKIATRDLKFLTNEDIFSQEPANVIQEMWRVININRRMDGAEEGMRELSSIVDVMLDKINEMELIINRMENILERVAQLESMCGELESRIDDANELTLSEIERLEKVIGALKAELELSRDTTRGLLATDHVILNHGQVTWTTPELAPPSPNYHTTPTGGRFSSGQI